MKSNKVVFVILTMAMAFSIVLSGCTKSTEKTNADSTPKPAETAATAAPTDQPKNEEPLEVSWSSFYDTNILDNTPTQQFIEEKFNVKLKLIRMDRENYSQNINLKIASGDIPDLFQAVGYDDMIKQGALASITLDEIKTFMPKLYEDRARMNDPLIFGLNERDGKYYMFPHMYSPGVNPSYNIIRDDLLKEAGIDKLPETIDDYTNAFKILSAKYPDMYMLTARGNTLWQSFTAFFGAYGYLPHSWTKSLHEDKIVFGMVQPEMKEAFKLLNSWYDAKYIDPEWITSDHIAKEGKFLNNKTIWVDWVFSNQLYEDGAFAMDFKKLNPQGTFAPIAYPKGPSGYSGGLIFRPYTGDGIGFGSHLEKDRDKLHRIMQMYDEIQSDKETFLRTYYGEENNTYVVTENGYEYTEKYKDTNARAEFGINYFWTTGVVHEGLFRSLIANKKEVDYNQQYFGPDKIYKVGYEGNYASYNIHNDEELKKKYDEQLNRILDKYFVGFITGNIDIDASWDKFVKEWEDGGGMEMGEAINNLNRSLFFE